MDEGSNKPSLIWRRMKSMNRIVVRKYGPKFRAYNIVLLLTTTGRKSGLPRTTPLQYEQYDGNYYVGSARGQQADWFRNILANPEVEVQVKENSFRAFAEPVTDPLRIADFFEIRLKRHPIFIGLIMRLEGLPIRFSRSDLERFAAEKAFVILRPVQGSVDVQSIPPTKT